MWMESSGQKKVHEDKSAAVRVQFGVPFENGNVPIFNESMLVSSAQKERKHGPSGIIFAVSGHIMGSIWQ